jgi:phosphatidylserine decarboxylase
MSLLATMATVAAPPHRAGRPFIAAGAAIAVFGLFTWHFLIGAGIAVALVCWFFFRDPARVPSPIPGAVLAAADGRITVVELAVPPAELGLGLAPRWRIATFLSVLNVHVNRVPVSGTVTAVAHTPGRFLNAADPAAGEANERNALLIRLPDGRDLAAVQIAGLIARRILCDVRAGDQVTAGARFGLIRFGSRTDIFLPPGVTPVVSVGQTAIGGETVMALLQAG